MVLVTTLETKKVDLLNSRFGKRLLSIFTTHVWSPWSVRGLSVDTFLKSFS